jgi:hypothetical protein
LKDEEAIDWCKRILTLSLDKGNKLKECHESLPKERGFLVYGKKKKKRRKCEEFFSSIVCNNQAWEECV